MKDLFFLQQKTWFQFRKTCKKIGLKTSISSTKDLMMWWKTYFIFNERLDFNSERLEKILFWRLPYLQWKTWWFDERLIFSSTKDLIPIQKDLQKSWFEDFYFFNKRLDDVMKDLQNFGLKTFISSTKDLMMSWKTYLFLQQKTWWCHERLTFSLKKDLIPRNLRNPSLFFNERLDDLMKDWLEGDLKVVERLLLLLQWKTWWL